MAEPSAKKQYNKFWWISLGVHAAILLGLFLTPARQIFFPEKEPPKRPDVTLRDRKLEEVVNKIRESEAAALAQRVALLEAGADRMGNNKQTFQNRFDEFNSLRIENAKAELRTSMDQTLQLLGDLRERGEEAVKKLDEEKPVATFVELTTKTSGRLLDEQEAIRRGLLLLEMNDALYSRQQEVDEQQISADQQMLWLRQHHERVVKARENIATFEKEHAELSKELDDYRKEVEEKRKLVERIDKKIADLNAKVKDENRLENRAKHSQDRSDRAHKEANEKARKAKRDDDQEREKRFKDEAREHRKKRDEARREMRRHADRAKDLRKQIEDLKDDRYREARRELNRSKRLIRSMENQLKRIEEQLASNKRNLENALNERKDKVQVSRNILTAAYYKQRDLVEEIRQALEDQPAPGAESGQSAGNNPAAEKAEQK